MNRLNFLACMSIMLLGVLHSVSYGGDPLVFVSDSGFNPHVVSTGSSTTDYFTAIPFDDTIPNAELPIDLCTYSWSVSSVTGPGSYTINLQDSTQQTCKIDFTPSADGDWTIVMEVAVTYPDGYTQVFRKRFEASTQDLYLAGEYERPYSFRTT